MKSIGELLQESMQDILKRERRFKSLVFNVAFEAKWLAKILDILPEQTYIIGCDRDLYEASNMILISAPEFDRVGEGEKVPRLIVEINHPDQSVKLFEEHWEDNKPKHREVNYSYQKAMNQPRRLLIEDRDG